MANSVEVSSRNTFYMFILKFSKIVILMLSLKGKQNRVRGISLFRNSVRDFSEQSDFCGFLVDFLENKRIFAKGGKRFFWSEMPLGTEGHFTQ